MVASRKRTSKQLAYIKHVEKYFEDHKGEHKPKTMMKHAAKAWVSKHGSRRPSRGSRHHGSRHSRK